MCAYVDLIVLCECFTVSVEKSKKKTTKTIKEGNRKTSVR